jgi:hypothetical protein
LASFAYKAAKNFQIRINLMVSSLCQHLSVMVVMSIAKLIFLLLTFGIEALLALASCMFEQCTDKFYFCLIARGVKVSKTVLASAIGKVALHVKVSIKLLWFVSNGDDNSCPSNLVSLNYWHSSLACLGSLNVATTYR